MYKYPFNTEGRPLPCPFKKIRRTLRKLISFKIKLDTEEDIISAIQYLHRVSEGHRKELVGIEEQTGVCAFTNKARHVWCEVTDLDLLNEFYTAKREMKDE